MKKFEVKILKSPILVLQKWYIPQKNPHKNHHSCLKQKWGFLLQKRRKKNRFCDFHSNLKKILILYRFRLNVNGHIKQAHFQLIFRFYLERVLLVWLETPQYRHNKDAGCQVILYFAAAVKEGLLRLMYRVSISQRHAASQSPMSLRFSEIVYLLINWTDSFSH